MLLCTTTAATTTTATATTTAVVTVTTTKAHNPLFPVSGFLTSENTFHAISGPCVSVSGLSYTEMPSCPHSLLLIGMRPENTQRWKKVAGDAINASVFRKWGIWGSLAGSIEHNGDFLLEIGGSQY